MHCRLTLPRNPKKKKNEWRYNFSFDCSCSSFDCKSSPPTLDFKFQHNGSTYNLLSMVCYVTLSGPPFILWHNLEAFNARDTVWLCVDHFHCFVRSVVSHFHWKLLVTLAQLFWWQLRTVRLWVYSEHITVVYNCTGLFTYDWQRSCHCQSATEYTFFFPTRRGLVQVSCLDSLEKTPHRRTIGKYSKVLSSLTVKIRC